MHFFLGALRVKGFKQGCSSLGARQQAYDSGIYVILCLVPSPRVRHRLIQVAKSMTVIFGENLGIGVIQGEGTLDYEKMTWIMIHEIIRYNKNQQISIP